MSIFAGRRYAYQNILKKYIRALRQPMPNLERLCELTPYLLVKSMGLKTAGVLVLDRRAATYVLRSAEGEARHLRGNSFSQDDPLFSALLEQKKGLLLNQTKDGNLVAQMHHLKGELFIPVLSQLKYFNEPTLLGVVYLGEMSSGEQFSRKDISFLFNLIKQAEPNIDTAFMHEEMRKTHP
ncbi:MAG: hypothetical protein ABIH69_00435 [bacterium]